MIRGAGLAVLALAPSIVAAAPPAWGAGRIEAQLEALRREDLRVATVAYRLAAAAGDLCPPGVAPAGLLVHDAAQYAPQFRAVAIRLFGLGDGPAVEAVVPGGPADAAGLRAGDRIVTIDGAPAGGDAPAAGGTNEADHAALDRLQAGLDRALARGPALIGVRRGDELLTARLAPRAGCASQVQLLPLATLDAGADGRLVSISTRLVEFTRDDDELALLIAHEMAHNALGHPAALAAIRARRGPLSPADAARIRRTEEEADRLGLYLMARAGFAIDRAADLWRRLGEGRIMLRSDPTHPGWRDRVARARATAAEIAAQRARGLPIRPRPEAVPVSVRTNPPEWRFSWLTKSGLLDKYLHSPVNNRPDQVT